MRNRTTRIYVDSPLEVGIEVQLPTSAAHHILRVLRMRTGDELTLFDGLSNQQFRAVITATERNSAAVRINSSESSNCESNLETSLIQAISSGDKMDFTIQKAVELGVSEIVPVYSERSAPVFKADRLKKRMQHWHQVIVSATEQCGRTVLAALREPCQFGELVENRSDGAAGVILDPRSSSPLSEFQVKENSVQIWIGPEGGFSSEEIDHARQFEIQPVAFGPRILRTETAGIAALTLLQAKFGDL